MNRTKTFTLIMLMSFFLSIHIGAQEKNKLKEQLKGLVKAEPGDNIGDIMIGNFPFYDADGKKIDQQSVMSSLMSGKYIPDFYLDKDQNIKAAVLRKTTEEEQLSIQNAMGKHNKGSDLVGEAALPFKATDMNGKTYSLEELKGKIIVMNFWFVECKPCLMEIPELNELVKKHSKENIVFLGFATNDTSKIKSFLKRKEFSYTILPNSMDISGIYDVTGYPTHIVIDQGSKIAYSTTGYGPNTVGSLEKTIERLLKK
ncbi:MAG: TlpA family protein disulfide reductase [Flavobacteriaceae bacterium]